MARGLGTLRRAFYTNPTEAALTALEDFIASGEQRQRSRAGVVGRGRRKMTRSNLKYARRPEGWREWVTALVKRRLPRHTSKPIPVHLRPGVPHVDAALGFPERRAAILDEARKALPAHQFKDVYGRWQQGAEAAEQRVAWMAERREFRAWMRSLSEKGKAA